MSGADLNARQQFYGGIRDNKLINNNNNNNYDPLYFDSNDDQLLNTESRLKLDELERMALEALGDF